MIRSILGLKPDGDDDDVESIPQARQDTVLDHAPDDESNWLISYADMMTLLCGFFIMLFVMAKMGDSQLEKMKQALASQFGGEYQPPHEDLSKALKELLETTPIKNDTEVVASGAGVTIVFRSKVFFETLSSQLSTTGRETLEQLVKALRDHEKRQKKTYRFVVEGHTDSRQILGGQFETNWELSAARAARVVRVFIDQGFAPNKMAALGYADTRPSEGQSPRDSSAVLDEEALARDRRVLIRVFNDSEAQVLDDLAEEKESRQPAAAQK